MLMLLRHVSYLQKEGTRPSSRPVAVSSFDSFVQQGGDLPFFTSRATRVIDAEYRCPVGVVLFNHSEVDFAVKPGDCVAQMIVQVIATPEVTEVEDLDTTVWGREDSGPPRFELRALVDTSREVVCLGCWWNTRKGTHLWLCAFTVKWNLVISSS
uniref:dUTP diphosphatase n=1 Tax=Aegilops tauschii subsp. strangulata TaxID=200361 RepID=A0A453D8P0_AEGTS|nr:deoxyuridine 5'-triphosphate nucleotidohydrolase [Aegilops tauschii subsp. strangulata]